MQPVPAPASELELLLFLAIVAAWPIVWRFITKRRVSYGQGRVMAHLMGATAGFCVSFTLFLAWISIVGNTGEFAVAVFAAMTAWGIRVWSMPPQVKSEKPTGQASVPSSFQASIPTPPPSCNAPTEDELKAIEATRRRSVEASKRAGKARKKDMQARGEKPAECVWAREIKGDWEDEIVLDADDFRMPQSVFTEIEFDYIDAQGDHSHRTVEVWAVDDEYFEGRCHKAHDTRTFVIGRIRGKVLVHDTGELLAPRRWAAQARRDPLNTGRVEGRLCSRRNA